jgi:hypothetical protein
MESKEKEEAERIVRLFYPLTYTAAVKPYSSVDAKRCAIIHIEGIIKDNNNTYQWAKNINLDEKTIHGLSRNIDYWQEVKQEIEKL